MLKNSKLKKVSEEIINLKNSPLYKERIANKAVPVIGEGSLDASIIFVGEAPGKNESLTGKPFCGASGKVLDQLLQHAGLTRESIYITNIVNDRPTGNRDPKPEEIALYSPFLLRQLEIIQPKVIATLGRFSMEFIMKSFGLENKIQTISDIHGKNFKVKSNWGEISFVPLFHPAVALYNRNRLDELKKDFKKLILSSSPRRRGSRQANSLDSHLRGNDG